MDVLVLFGALTFLVLWIILKNKNKEQLSLFTSKLVIGGTQTFSISGYDMSSTPFSGAFFDFSPDGTSTIFDFYFTNSSNIPGCFPQVLTFYSSYSTLTSIVSGYIKSVKPWGGTESDYNINVYNNSIYSTIDDTTTLSVAEFTQYDLQIQDDLTIWTDDTVFRVVYSNPPTNSFSVFVGGGGDC